MTIDRPCVETRVGQMNPGGTTRSVGRPKKRWIDVSCRMTVDEISKRSHSMENPGRGPYPIMDESMTICMNILNFSKNRSMMK